MMEVAVLFELPTTYKIMSEHDMCYLCAAGYDEGLFRRTLGDPRCFRLHKYAGLVVGDGVFTLGCTRDEKSHLELSHCAWPNAVHGQALTQNFATSKRQQKDVFSDIYWCLLLHIKTKTRYFYGFEDAFRGVSCGSQPKKFKEMLSQM